ncbi:pilus assembly protein TadG-related protein, partial [Paraperlucidibaca sp.]|uniref:pilus assembly protein TadG-related protein n=1 Tax=Paraperlucidibaca sp. TaxID=2708021 RepID=UPI0030F39519
MNYRRPPSFIPAYQQRGALMIMAAGFMLLGVLCLALVVDTGRLYLNKRNLQRVIDVAALEVASRGGQCDDGSALAIAQESLARNGFVLGSTQRLISPVCGEVVVASGVRTLAVGDGLPQGVGLRVEQDTPASLVAGGIMGNTITLAASAVASAKGGPLAMLTLRSSLLNVNITKNSKAQLLSSVFGGLLGGNLNISVGA